MLLTVDTNIFFTYFWENSLTKDLLKRHKLIAPKISLAEINKYKSLILSKTGISDMRFSSLIKELDKIVDFISEEKYVNKLEEIELHINSLDITENEKLELLDDADFLAIALNFKSGLWSNDKLLKKQSLVDVFNTREVIELTVFTSMLFSSE